MILHVSSEYYTFQKYSKTQFHLTIIEKNRRKNIQKPRLELGSRLLPFVYVSLK